ncbi:hypothetical protein ES708_13649 [subsurface metagenome]
MCYNDSMKWSLLAPLLLLALLASGCSAATGIDFNISIENNIVQVDAYYVDVDGNRLGDVSHDGYLYFEGEPVKHSETALEANPGEGAIIEWARCSYFVNLWEFDDELRFPIERLEQSGIDLTKPVEIQLRVGDFGAEKELWLRPLFCFSSLLLQ